MNARVPASLKVAAKDHVVRAEVEIDRAMMELSRECTLPHELSELRGELSQITKSLAALRNKLL